MASAPRLILASASPRREELLRQLGVPFTVVRSDLPEELTGGSPVESVRALALAKARAVAGRVATGVVLGADTVVVLDGVIFGKPANPDDARRMLRALQGRSHEVITGVALVEAPAPAETSLSASARGDNPLFRAPALPAQSFPGGWLGGGHRGPLR